MAKASKEIKEVEKIVFVKEPIITLQLSEAEATTLYTILQNVGGNAKRTARKYSDEIVNALIEAKVDNNYDWEENGLLDGSITFREDSLAFVEKHEKKKKDKNGKCNHNQEDC